MTNTGQLKRESHQNTGRELGFFVDVGMRGSSPSNDQDHRAAGPPAITVEQSKNVIIEER